MRTAMTMSTLVATALLAGCLSGGVKMGEASGASTVATGGAAGANADGANKALERCAETLGTITLVEDQGAPWYIAMTQQYNLPPSASLLRLLIQQSNCFVVVERGAAGNAAMNRERELAKSGDTRRGSKFGKGQLVAADYAMMPELTISEENTGGLGNSLGGLLGPKAAKYITALDADAKTREAAALLSLIDNRSGVQVAAAEGSASKTDWGGMVTFLGPSGNVTLNKYAETPQGKVVAGAFMDAYNQMVRSLRNYKAQQVSGGLGTGGRLKVAD